MCKWSITESLKPSLNDNTELMFKQHLKKCCWYDVCIMYHNQCKYLIESIQGKFYQAEAATYYLVLVLITYQITDLQCDYFIYFINGFLINVFLILKFCLRFMS